MNITATTPLKTVNFLILSVRFEPLTCDLRVLHVRVEPSGIIYTLSLLDSLSDVLTKFLFSLQRFHLGESSITSGCVLSVYPRIDDFHLSQ